MLGFAKRRHTSRRFGDKLRGGAGTSQNLERLTFADNNFDAIVTEDTAEQVRYVDRAFAEIARVLRPGGANIFTAPLFKDRRRWNESSRARCE